MNESSTWVEPLRNNEQKKPVKFGHLDSTKTTMDERIGSDLVSGCRQHWRTQCPYWKKSHTKLFVSVHSLFFLGDELLSSSGELESSRKKVNSFCLSPALTTWVLALSYLTPQVNILQSLRTQDEFKTKIRGSVDRLLRKNCSHSRNVGNYLIPFLFVISIVISLS